jgi:hypothetical protein
VCAQLATYSEHLHGRPKLCLAAIQLGYDFILFEEAFDSPQLSQRYQTSMKFLKRAAPKQHK